MKTVFTMGFFLAAGLLAAPGSASADDSFAAAHDDAGYPAQEAAAIAADGSGGWGPGLAHDDTAYPDGPKEIASSDVRVADATRPGHDDTSYPVADASPRADAPRRVAARTPQRP